MQTFKIGDKVTVLHDTLSGTIIDISGNSVTIEDEDGFERIYLQDKLVLLKSGQDYKIDTVLPNKDHLVRPVKLVDQNTGVTARDTYEIDLHIEELRDVTTHFTNFEIVQIQMTACRAFVKESLSLGRKRVVLIHGKGEGVLKSEIHTYLERLISNEGVRLEYHDASFQRYGIGGATEVIFY